MTEPAEIDEAAIVERRVLDVLGVCLEVVSEVELGWRLDHLFGMFPASEKDPSARIGVRRRDGGFTVFGHDGKTADEEDLDRASMRLLSALNGAVLHDTPYLGVHAGAVATDDRVFVWPGKSGAGKSTLTAAAVMAGMRYVSDEALVIDPNTGEVVPYPKPLWLSDTARDLAGVGDRPIRIQPEGLKAPVTVEELGGRPATGRLSLPVSVIELEQGWNPAHVQALPAAEGVSLLIKHSFHRKLRPEAVFRLSVRVMRGARAWRLRYDAPRDGAARLGRLAG